MEVGLKVGMNLGFAKTGAGAITGAEPWIKIGFGAEDGAIAGRATKDGS